jgi:SAM-dependent methyltransferase
LGCGSAALATELAPTFTQVIGVDLVPATLRRRDGPVGSQPRLVAGNAEELPIRSASIDFLFSYGVLHHADLGRALAEVRRVVAPGGVAVLIDFVSERPATNTRMLPHVRSALSAFPGYWRRRGPEAALVVTAFRLSPGWLEHVRGDLFLTPPAFVERYAPELPDARFDKLVGRMAAVWLKPSTPNPAKGPLAPRKPIGQPGASAGLIGTWSDARLTHIELSVQPVLLALNPLLER